MAGAIVVEELAELQTVEALRGIDADVAPGTIFGCQPMGQARPLRSGS
jgi:hypothetical protein